MTIVELIKNEKAKKEIDVIAGQEKVTPEFIINGILLGEITVPKNINRQLKNPCGVGSGLKTKVNANIGTSPDCASIDYELEKMNECLRAGADAVMDLSTGGNITKIRENILKHCPVPLGTVPIYQVACETFGRGKKIIDMDPKHIFSVIEEQAQQGVDFMTVHCGVTKKTVEVLNRTKRLGGIVSRGGSFLAKWIGSNDAENPLYEQFDRLLDIAEKYDVTLSLGDGLRPGCLKDASDAAQIAELKVLGDLVLRARERNVQVIVEGPGHMPLNQIESHVKEAKKIIHDAPYYLLGPLVTDVAAGYDHITCAIGGAIAASAGADFICYVTPAEHLRLPKKEDVYLGVIAARIAAHAADIAKGVPNAQKWDDEFSKWRKALNWEEQQKIALDPEKFKSERGKLLPNDPNVCTMCSQYCAIKEEK
ncbi:MAG: phosphomethylpyrimidine synthase ThiC [Endomicrobiales bacterium]|nr:phosphomethylpyrimidine synthase ThiC [Endomicrobiales bacterium]